MASKEITVEELAKNANKYGAPTWEQFRKNPGKYRTRKDQSLIAADAGSQLFTNVKRQTYRFVTRAGVVYDCGTSLEKIQNIAHNEGIGIEKLIVRPEMRPSDSGKIEIEVTYHDPRHPQFTTPKIILP